MSVIFLCSTCWIRKILCILPLQIPNHLDYLKKSLYGGYRLGGFSPGIVDYLQVIGWCNMPRLILSLKGTHNQSRLWLLSKHEKGGIWLVTVNNKLLANIISLYLRKVIKLSYTHEINRYKRVLKYLYPCISYWFILSTIMPSWRWALRRLTKGADWRVIYRI